MESPLWKPASSRNVVLLAGGLAAAGLLPWLAPVELQFAVLACLIVLLVVLALALSDSIWKLSDHADLLPLLLGIAKEPRLLELYRRLGASQRDISIAVRPRRSWSMKMR